jgi:hypothetical protein
MTGYTRFEGKHILLEDKHIHPLVVWLAARAAVILEGFRAEFDIITIYGFVPDYVVS